MDIWLVHISGTDGASTITAHFSEADAWREAGEYARNNWADVEDDEGDYIDPKAEGVLARLLAHQHNARVYFAVMEHKLQFDIAKTRVKGIPPDDGNISWLVGRYEAG